MLEWPTSMVSTRKIIDIFEKWEVLQRLHSASGGILTRHGSLYAEQHWGQGLWRSQDPPGWYSGFHVHLLCTDIIASTITLSLAMSWPTSKTSSILGSHQILTKAFSKHIKQLEDPCALRVCPWEVREATLLANWEKSLILSTLPGNCAPVFVWIAYGLRSDQQLPRIYPNLSLAFMWGSLLIVLMPWNGVRGPLFGSSKYCKTL